MNKEERVATCKQVIEETTNDMLALDGKPFNGSTMAEAIGNLSAGICALAAIIIELEEDEGSDAHQG